MTDDDPLLETRDFPGGSCLLAPALVRGRLVRPRWPTVADLRALRAAGPGAVIGPTRHGDYLLARAAVDPATRQATGELAVVVTPALPAADLLEPDPARARAELLGLRADDVAQLADAVSAELRRPRLREAFQAASTALATAGSRCDTAVLRQLAGLVDGAAITRLVRNDLLGAAAHVDGWVDAPEAAVAGRTARVAAGDPRLAPTPLPPETAQVRAVPTTQVHLTAGNTPVVLATSLLWGWASRGALVVKAAHEVAWLLAVLAPAIAQAGRDHPLARHTSLVYWPGGEAAIEDLLLRPEVTERVLAWGSGPSLDAVVTRRRGGDLVLMRPRRAISLVGAGALDDRLATDTVRRAAADSVVADQAACMSSLLHLVEGPPALADAYAAQLLELLADWQAVLPYHPSPGVSARVVEWRRGALAAAAWRTVGTWPDVTAGVVRVAGRTDLGRHPGGRVVLVRAVPRLAPAAASEAGPDVSHVGVAPMSLVPQLREDLVCRGVDNVAPLGEAERSFAGMPHDGVRMVHRLLRWVTA